MASLDVHFKNDAGRFLKGHSQHAGQSRTAREARPGRTLRDMRGYVNDHGIIDRVREPAHPLPPGPLRLLVAVVGLFRHVEQGQGALHNTVVAPNEANGTTVRIALFTDPSTICSSKERDEGRCACLSMPSNIEGTAQQIYGPRLVKVHLAEFRNQKARLLDAWYAGGLRQLSQHHHVTLVLRPDVMLSRPLLVRDACRPGGSECGSRNFRCSASTQGWSSYLACSKGAASVMLSADADDDDAPMIADNLGTINIWLQLLACS
jgi:hypothetical protein